ncbi:MAG: hypothetical protein MZW92_18685 [Comamonadaceae bacterium]|nr:hypothetical protein [Comamonadaceae bacterium]
MAIVTAGRRHDARPHRADGRRCDGIPLNVIDTAGAARRPTTRSSASASSARWPRSRAPTSCCTWSTPRARPPTPTCCAQVAGARRRAACRC